MTTRTIDPEFLELMPLTVRISRYTGTDTVGNNTYATAIPVRARIEQPTTTMLTALADAGSLLADPGEHFRLIIDWKSPGFTKRDKVTMPDGSNVIIESALTEWDEKGPYHQDLTCTNNKER